MMKKMTVLGAALVFGIGLAGTVQAQRDKESVRGNEGDTVAVCHYYGKDKAKSVTLYVNISGLEGAGGLAAHLAHGDEIGPCQSDEEPPVIIE